jgi:cytoskeletal protein RodZ
VVAIFEDTEVGTEVVNTEVDIEVTGTEVADTEDVDTEVADTEVADTEVADTEVSVTEVSDTEVADTVADTVEGTKEVENSSSRVSPLIMTLANTWLELSSPCPSSIVDNTQRTLQQQWVHYSRDYELYSF